MLKKHLFYLIIFVAIVGALSGASTAKAASPFDNVAQTITNDEAGMVCGINTWTYERIMQTLAMSESNATWSGYIPREEAQEQARLSIESGSWAWTQRERGSPYGEDLRLYFINAPNGSTEFFYVAGQTQNPALKLDSPSDQKFRIDISCIGDELNFFTLPPYGTPYGAYTGIISWPNDLRKYLFATGDITEYYPDGYEGPPIQTQPPTVSNPSDFAPQMHVQFATDWKATFLDSYFTTVDSNPFLCNDMFAPTLHFELFDRTNPDDEILLLTASYSASAVYDYQFTKKPIRQEFRIVAWYSCPDNDLIFTQSSYKDFLIDGNGNLLRRGLNTCIQNEWPFLIWEDCMDAMNEIASTIMFNFQNPTNNAISTVAAQNPDNCHVLTTLDAWIYTPNQLVCPAVPKHVRDAVTPFVLFVLASVVFMYISRSKATVIS